MARPKKNNADYFSHDSCMRNNDKIKALRRKFKLEGYAIWCMFLEKLTDSDNFEIQLNKLTYELMSGDFEICPDKLKEIIDYCVQIELIKEENGLFYSGGLKLRLQGVLDKRNRAKGKFLSQKGKKTGVSVTENTQSKVNKSKVNKSKVNKVISTKVITTNVVSLKKLIQSKFDSNFYNILETKYNLNKEDTKEQANNFYLYWSEKKPNGKKELRQMQKTFDVQRRFYKWLNNNEKWNNLKEEKVSKSYTSVF